jgi:hypothetical protein
MNRQELIRSIGLVVGAVAMPWRAKASPDRVPTRRRVALQEAAVAGFQYNVSPAKHGQP